MSAAAEVEVEGDVLLEDVAVELAVLTIEVETTRAIVDDPDEWTGELLLAAGFDAGEDAEEELSSGEEATMVELDPSTRDEADVDTDPEAGAVADGIAEDEGDVMPMLKFVIVNSGEALPLSPNRMRI